MLGVTFSAYCVVMVIFLGSNTTAGCVTVLAFSFSFCYTAPYFPSVMLHNYLQLNTIHVFIFISYQLNFDTGYGIANILLTTQYFWCHPFHTWQWSDSEDICLHRCFQ